MIQDARRLVEGYMLERMLLERCMLQHFLILTVMVKETGDRGQG